MEGIEKRFGRVTALMGARLAARAGEVHCVLGENGAGKTTLLSVLAGTASADAGTVRLDGARVRVRTPREAWRHGVGMVHQHFALVPRFSVLENLALGHRSTRAGFGLPLEHIARRATGLAEETGLVVPFHRRVEDLGVGDRQRAEILKVLLREPRVLILDEPTAVLAPPEVRRLLALLRRLAGQGRAVLLVAHKLDEVLAVADRVTVLRHGATVLEAVRSEVDAHVLATAMLGGTGVRTDEVGVAGRVDTGPEVASDGTPENGTDMATGVSPHAAAEVATLSGVTLVGPAGERLLDDVSLRVWRGEIVGVAGVEGNGQRELARVLAARQPVADGTARVPADAAFIPQDRRREGLVLEMSLAENVALALQRDARYRRGPFLSWRRIRQRTADLMREHDIRAPGPDTRAGTLSGGNQQRLVVARELEGGPALLVAENPTRGLDVAGAAAVRERLRALRDRGREGPGIVLVSTDLDEVLALADRLVVIVRGRLIAVPDSARTRDAVGRLMLSGGEAEA
jgi:simple sugar transport system ATP-binding protein